MIPAVKTSEQLHVLGKRASRAPIRSSRDAQRLRELVRKAVEEQRRRKKKSVAVRTLKRVSSEPVTKVDKAIQRPLHAHGGGDTIVSDGIEELRCVNAVTLSQLHNAIIQCVLA